MVARTVTASYLAIVVLTWWLTCGEEPWVWRGSGRTELSAPARFLFAALQLNFAVLRWLALAAAFALVVVVLAGVVTAGVILWEYLATSHVSWGAIGDFYGHQLPDFIQKVAHGRAVKT